MRVEQLIKFQADKSEEDVKEYLNRLIDNLKDLSKLSFKYFIFSVSLMFVYYLLLDSQLSQLQIGIVKVNDLKTVKLFIPALFTLTYFLFVLVEERKMNLLHQAKTLLNLKYIKELGKQDISRSNTNEFNISYLPFSFADELALNMRCDSFLTGLGLFLTIIFSIVIGVGVYVIEFFMIKDMVTLWSESLFVKLTIIGTITIALISLYFTINVVAERNNQKNEDKLFLNRISDN